MWIVFVLSSLFSSLEPKRWQLVCFHDELLFEDMCEIVVLVLSKSRNVL